MDTLYNLLISGHVNIALAYQLREQFTKSDWISALNEICDNTFPLNADFIHLHRKQSRWMVIDEISTITSIKNLSTKFVRYLCYNNNYGHNKVIHKGSLPYWVIPVAKLNDDWYIDVYSDKQFDKIMKAIKEIDDGYNNTD